MCVHLKKEKLKDMAVGLKHTVGELRLTSKKEWPMRKIDIVKERTPFKKNILRHTSINDMKMNRPKYKMCKSYELFRLTH